MHKQILKDATEEQLRKFACIAIGKVHNQIPDLYDELELDLYKLVYGCHFNEAMLNKALSHMINEDGSTGGFWSLEKTNSIARNYDVKFDTFNEYDWCYVMNMLYSDYYGVVSNDTASYVSLALKFLNDKDAPPGKAFKYFLAMN